MAKWIPSFEIEGISVPLPDNYNQTLTDFSSEETGRTLDGVMHKDVVAVKFTAPFEWGKLEWNVAAQLAKAVDGKSSVSVKFMDVRNPYTMTSKTVYIGDRSFEPVVFDTDGKVYWSVKFSEIEV